MGPSYFYDEMAIKYPLRPNFNDDMPFLAKSS